MLKIWIIFFLNLNKDIKIQVYDKNLLEKLAVNHKKETEKINKDKENVQEENVFENFNYSVKIKKDNGNISENDYEILDNRRKWIWKTL